MNCHRIDWGLDDASKLLRRLIDALDDDCVVVRDFYEKLKMKLETFKNDPDFTKFHGVCLLSMGLSKPHQVAFDKHIEVIQDTKTISSLLEPFDKTLRSKMQLVQKKHFNGDARQLPLGDLTKTEYRKCGLIATQKIKPPEEPKKAKPEGKVGFSN